MKRMFFTLLIVSIFSFNLFAQEEEEEFNEESTTEEEPATDLEQQPSEKTPQTLEEQPRYIYVSERSPHIAVALSAVVGFGLGNYYAKDINSGVIATATEVAGWGLFVASWIIIDDDNDGFMERSELKTNALSATETAFLITSLCVVGGSRIFGSITAAQAANRFNKKLKQKFRYDTQLSPFFYANSESRGAGFSFRF